MNEKKQLGQFYSTNSDKLLKDFIPAESIIEPFVGNGDLIKWAIKKGLKRYTAFDISPSNTLKYKCIKRDTLSNPPIYKDKFVLTNPPYLAKNKNTDKNLYQDFDDLYKLFISQIIQGEVLGGIIIIPLNFLCGTRLSDIQLRNDFLSNYSIKQINIFLNPIFSDTTYTVCSIWFEKSNNKLDSQSIKIWWHDEKEYSVIDVCRDHCWLLGGEIYSLGDINYDFSVTRLTNKEVENAQISNIKLHGLDTRDERIHLEYNTEPYIGKNTDRMFATIVFINLSKKLTKSEQKQIIEEFNNLLNCYRDKYKSMFLTNYRDYGRKRIGFDLVYSLIAHIVCKLGIA